VNASIIVCSPPAFKVFTAMWNGSSSQANWFYMHSYLQCIMCLKRSWKDLWKRKYSVIKITQYPQGLVSAIFSLQRSAVYPHIWNILGIPIHKCTWLQSAHRCTSAGDGRPDVHRASQYDIRWTHKLTRNEHSGGCGMVGGDISDHWTIDV